MMSDPGVPTFDQLRVFLTVADAGTLAEAGRRLGRATSAISYAIDNLEAQLGITLLDRETTRKPKLTEAGRAVLAEACTLSRGIDALRAKVKGMIGGLEPEVSIAVDVMLPTARLVDALQAFQAEFPTVGVRLHVEALGGVTQLVLDGTATLGISGPLPNEAKLFDRIPLGSVRMVPVAAPGHPLAALETLPIGIVREHVQLVLTDRSPLTEGQDFGVLSVKTWRLADLGAKHALLLAGVGWGYMPETIVREDLAAGRLKRLNLPDASGETYLFHAIYPSAFPPGPAGQWLIDRFLGQGV